MCKRQSDLARRLALACHPEKLYTSLASWCEVGSSLTPGCDGFMITNVQLSEIMLLGQCDSNSMKIDTYNNTPVAQLSHDSF